MIHGFATTTTDALAGVSLDDTLAVITGASTGIGLETARALASVGAHIVMAGRNAEKHAAAIATIRTTVPNARVEHVELDLTSLRSAREAAAAIRAAHPRVDLLINNAGVMYTPLERTAEGFEWQFGINHLGHFVFTNHLLPSVLAAAPARVINLSSGGHAASDIAWDDPNYRSRPYDKFAAYGQAKTANILFTVELQRRLAARGVESYAVHPGMIVTELGRYMTREDMAALREKIAAAGRSGGPAPTYKTVEQGAATTVWAATAAELTGHGGTYLADCAVSAEHAPWARDPASARRLWALSESLVGETFP